VTELRQVLGRLYGLVRTGPKLGLERMEAACRNFGNPERSFEVVHVAGTNGKGTVCAFVASMAKAAGRRTGMFTSPHLIKFAERIQIDGCPLADEVLAELLDTILAREPELTFFEVATLAAFIAFRDARVDIAVLEVGLGGRLDATNVIPPPRVAAITRVAFDHMDLLGDTLASIAAEKAGIIKPGSAVVLGKLHPDARAVVERRIVELGARLVPLGSPEPIPGAPLGYPRVAMLGSNLAVATATGRELGLTPQEMARGIEATTWPGRNELLHRNGQDITLLDAAHNPDGAVTLSHLLDPTLLAEIDSRREIALVFGALRTKNWKAMLRRLEHVAGHRVYVSPPVDLAVEPTEMARYLRGDVASSVPDALVRARALVGHRGVVVVTGSSFLVGAARALLLGLESDPPVVS
jgi:dihydrofolate synthase / folylpolyglutamate synthase